MLRIVIDVLYLVMPIVKEDVSLRSVASNHWEIEQAGFKRQPKPLAVHFRVASILVCQ